MIRGEAKALREEVRAPSTLQEAYLNGLIMADGHVGPYSTYLRMGPLAESLLRDLAVHFGIEFKQYNSNQGRVQNTIYSSSWPQCWKTSALEVASPELELARLQGLFDGDGCITSYLNRKGKRYIQMYQARSLSEGWIGDYFVETCHKFGIGLRVKPAVGKDNTVKHHLASQQDAVRMLRLIYRPPVFVLPQKYSRALEVMA